MIGENEGRIAAAVKTAEIGKQGRKLWLRRR